MTFDVITTEFPKYISNRAQQDVKVGILKEQSDSPLEHPMVTFPVWTVCCQIVTCEKYEYQGQHHGPGKHYFIKRERVSHSQIFVMGWHPVSVK